MITLFLSMVLFVLFCAVDTHAAADEYDDNISYRKALKIYVDAFGPLDTMIKVPPKGEGQGKMLNKIAEVKTKLIAFANKSLEQDAYSGAVTDIMHLVGLLESAVYASRCSEYESKYYNYKDYNEKGENSPKKKSMPLLSPILENKSLPPLTALSASPRVVEVHEKIREKSKFAIHHDACSEDEDELKQALHIYRSYFGSEDEPFKVTPRGATEMNGVIYSQKTNLIQLGLQAGVNGHISNAKKIMELVGSLECAQNRKETESPRVIEAHARIMKWQHEKSLQ